MRYDETSYPKLAMVQAAASVKKEHIIGLPMLGKF
jgi:hypothetical protein